MGILFGKCIAIVAHICINAPSNIEIRQSNEWSGAIIVAGMAELSVTYSTDDIPKVEMNKTKLLCLDKSCINVMGSCSAYAGINKCDVIYKTPSDSVFRDISFKYSERNSERDLSGISVIVEGGRGIPLLDIVNLIR